MSLQRRLWEWMSFDRFDITVKQKYQSYGHMWIGFFIGGQLFHLLRWSDPDNHRWPDCRSLEHVFIHPTSSWWFNNPWRP